MRKFGVVYIFLLLPPLLMGCNSRILVPETEETPSATPPFITSKASATPSAVPQMALEDMLIAAAEKENKLNIDLIDVSESRIKVSFQDSTRSQLFYKSYFDSNGNAYVLTMDTSGFLTVTRVQPDGEIDSVEVRTHSHLSTISMAHEGAILVASAGLNESGNKTFYFHRVLPSLDVTVLDYEVESITKSCSPADIVPLGQGKYLIPWGGTVLLPDDEIVFYFLTVDLGTGRIESETIPLKHPDLLKSANFVYTVNEDLTQIVLLNYISHKYYRYDVTTGQAEQLTNFPYCGGEPRMDYGYFIYDSFFYDTVLEGKVVAPFSFQTVFDTHQYPALEGEYPKIVPLDHAWGVLTSRQVFLFDMDGNVILVKDLPEDVWGKDLVLLQPLVTED